MVSKGLIFIVAPTVIVTGFLYNFWVMDVLVVAILLMIFGSTTKRPK